MITCALDVLGVLDSFLYILDISHALDFLHALDVFHVLDVFHALHALYAFLHALNAFI